MPDGIEVLTHPENETKDDFDERSGQRGMAGLIFCVNVWQTRCVPAKLFEGVAVSMDILVKANGGFAPLY